MIFRKHQDPEPPRARIDSLSGGDGLLILPGADASAVHAWLTQLLQERPGNFAPDQALWERWKDEIFLNRRFQPGSVSYTWVEVWPLLFRNEVAWVYAPINRIRELSSYRMGLLDAARFPEPPSWNEYGLQADVLWAIPVGEEKHLKRLNKAAGWLKDPQTQTIIANEIEWIPAHPSGTPFNALTWETQIAWLRSSFVWQDPDEH
jgi:hypothetical protein